MPNASRFLRRTDAATKPLVRSAAILAACLVVLSAAAAPAVPAEKMPTPKYLLRQEAFVLEVTILSTEAKSGPHAGSSVWHRVRVDRVERGEGLRTGDEVAVVSRTYELPSGSAGTTGHRGGWKGPNGLPRAGDRARLFASGTPTTLQPHFTNGWQPIEPVVAFVAADDEYRSEVTMPFLAELVAKPLGVTATTHLATDQAPTGGPNAIPKVEAKTNLTGSRALRRADAIVAYMRFETLDRATLDDFLEPLEHGVPLVAFRTTTHAFRYPDGDRHAPLNDGFGEKYLGTPWRFHHGHSSRTRVLPPDAERAKHPILAAVAIPPEGLVVPSWLYHVEPLPDDCTVLLWGEAVDSERKDAPQRQPVLWVRERAVERLAWRDPKAATPPAPPAQRVAATTLGHPGDFASPEFRLIAAQMVAWAAARESEFDDEERKTVRDAAFSPPPTR